MRVKPDVNEALLMTHDCSYLDYTKLPRRIVEACDVGLMKVKCIIN